jgi:transcription elongation factor GreA
MNQPAPAPALPVSLVANPRLSSWLKFSSTGQVTVSPGKVVSYRYDGDDDEESFLLGAREIAEDHTDIEVYSPESPLGAAMLGHKAGETVDLEQPNGRTAKIAIVSAVPFTV